MIFTTLRSRIAVIATGSLIAVSCTALAAPALAATTPATAPPVATKYDKNSFTEAAFAARATGMPAGQVAAVNKNLGISAATYLAEGAAAASAVNTVNSLSGVGVKVLGSSISGTTLTVNVATKADAALVTAAGGSAVVGTPAPRVNPAALTFAPASGTVLDGSGYLFTNAAGSTYQCSAGLNGFASTGASQFVTAGHCLAGMDSNQAVVALVQNAPGLGGSFGSLIGRPVAGTGKFGPATPGYDAGRIALVSGVTGVPAAETWGANGQSAPGSSAPAPITGQSAAIVGANLCKSGSRSGWTCGVIQAVDQTVNISGTSTTVNSILATTCVLGGDSGGIGMTGSIAIGVTSTSTNSSGSCATSSISGFFPLVSLAGKPSVSGQYGTSWELAVTVAPPVVTTVTGGTTATPGTIKGTVAGGTPSNTVRLYLDGSTTAAATAPATNGAFTIQLPVTTAGSHSYRLVTTWGVYSKSTAATGTFSTSSTVAPNTPSPAPSPTATTQPAPPASPTPRPHRTFWHNYGARIAG